jgi:glycine/D-amino acid oxidase-like deaminating enzyme
MADDPKRAAAEAASTYFAATAEPHPARPRLTQDIDTSACIVGGGFAGLWTARALARRGYDVVVIDAGTVGGEASGRSAGFVSAGYAAGIERIIDRVGLDQAKSLYSLSRHGMELVSNLVAEGASGVAPVPGRLNVMRHDDEEGARRRADLLAEEFGHEMLVWPTERVRETLKSEHYYQALHDADAFSVHPLNLALVLAAEIEKHGGRIFHQTKALGADLEGVRKWIATEHGRVRAHDVVFCGSALIGDGFPQLARAILPIASYVGATRPLGAELQETVGYSGSVSEARRIGNYYRVIGDRLLWGTGLSIGQGSSRGLKRRIAREIARVYPTLKDVAIEYAWPGRMGYAIHRMPQIGMLRPGVWVASAFGGHGLNTSAMAGELVATGIIDNDDRWRQFIPFGLVWAGGIVGREVTRVLFWDWRLRQRIKEAKSRQKERRAKRAAAAGAARLAAEEEERKQKEEAQRLRDAEELKKLLAIEEEEQKRKAEALAMPAEPTRGESKREEAPVASAESVPEARKEEEAQTAPVEPAKAERKNVRKKRPAVAGEK